MKVKNGRETITSKIAYIAGFFDGEGCIRIKKANQGGNSYYIIAHLTNTYPKTLKEVKQLFGGSMRVQEKGVNKKVYNWSITSDEASDFLRTLLPFLKEKRPQAVLALRFHKNKDKMVPAAKKADYERMMRMKKEVIGNTYENPELL